ncbi:MAG TPA: DUF2066 domain-containing protein, partial [Alphaproteobacteria bacterium]|nr:DUF2066 domain-containing protein [Alphaproteobacteria bacterium]
LFNRIAGFMFNKASVIFLKIFTIALFLIAFSAPSFALEKLIKGASPEVNPYGQPRSQRPAQMPVMEDSMLIVTDVIVDKTAQNAVLAREEAMGEARRLAFRMLAERHLSPSAYANLKMPNDTTIATLVQDFEIKSEQLSSTRYVANFTVRFRDAVRNFISIPVMPRRAYDDNVGTGSALPGAAQNSAMANQQTPTGTMMPPTLDDGSLLILPYYENMAGKTVLWEDPNPWRQMWQLSPPRPSNGKHQVTVPMGDIADISAGSADAVWTGDYTAIEKLRRQYGVAQVVLAVANKSGAYMTIDMHVYDGKSLRRRNALTPYVGEKPDDAAWQQAMYEVISYLQRPQPNHAGATVENISRSVTRPQLNVPEINNPSVTTYAPPERPRSMYAETYQPPQAPSQAPYEGPRPAFVVNQSPYPAANDGAAAAQGAEEDPYQTSMTRFGIATQVEAAFAFSNFGDWMDVQKRLSAANPPVRMDIRAISRNSARFVLRYNGNVDMLRQTLAGQGIGMTAVQSAGGAPVYTLHLVQ